MPLDQINTYGLTNTEIVAKAPSVFAPFASPKVSDKYVYIDTSRVIDRLRDCGLVVDQVREGKTRDPDGRAFVMHEVRMRKAGYTPDHDLGGLSPQLILINSHNRSTGMTALAGMLRGLCHNGMFWGEGAFGFKAMHLRTSIEQVVEGCMGVVERFDNVIENARGWSQIEMTKEQRRLFAAKALEIRDTAMKLDPIDLLGVRRHQDEGSDLWKTYNVVQENLTHGGQRAQTTTGKWRALGGIKALSSDVSLNRKLWQLADSVAKELVPA